MIKLTKFNTRLELYYYILLPVVLFTIILAWGFYHFELNSRLLMTQTETKNHVNLQIQTISLNFSQIISDLKFLSKQQGLMNYLENPDKFHQQYLASDYLNFSKNKKMYDQIRFLDESGQERVRVNYNNGAPLIVSDKRLQNKGKRYYFTDAYRLAEGEIFVSPFDLNIEKGTIEQPIKPVIRFAIPVFDNKGQKRGIVLLNYLGKQLLNRFRQTASELPGKMLLLNRNGYSLSSDNSDNDWLFMYSDKKTGYFAKQNNTLWQEISAMPYGQFRHNRQLITYNTVSPLKQEIHSSSGSTKAYSSSQQQLSGQDYFWKVVSVINKKDPALSSQNSIYALISFTLFITLITFAGTWALSRSRSRLTRQALELRNKVAQLEQAQQQLIQSETMASLGRMVAGFAHEINTPVGIALGAASQIDSTSQSLTELLQQEEVEEDDLLDKLQTLQQASNLTINNLNRAAKLISSFKRSSVDQTSNQIRSFLPSEMIQDVLNALKNKLKQSNISINISCSKTLKIKGQPGLLDQVFTNLILNSFNHAFKNGHVSGIINIDIELRNNTLFLNFQDNGSGMNRQTLEKIFEPFFTTDRVEGTGLGLYICYNIIKSELKGHINCQSEVNHGTRFEMSFPVNSKDSGNKIL